MLDLLPAHLAHAIAARLLDARDAENGALASPALLPPASASLRVPAAAADAERASACWMRSPAAAPASAKGLETRAVLRLDPARPTDPGALRAALTALAATGRRVVALELVVGGAAAAAAAAAGAAEASSPPVAAPVAVPSTACVDARALFADAAELLGGSLRSVAVRNVKLQVDEAETLSEDANAADARDAAAAKDAAADKDDAEAAPSPSRPQRPLLLLESLELDGALSTPGEFLAIVEAAVRPVVRATERLAVRFRPAPFAPARERRQRPPAAAQPWGAALASACAALSRDALGRPYLREVDLLGLPKDDAAVEEAMRCVSAAAGGLSRLRLGAATAASTTPATTATTTTAAAKTTVMVVEAEWTALKEGGPLMTATPTFVSAHARVAAPAGGALARDDVAGALAAAMPSASSLSPVGALTLLLPPSALLSPEGTEHVAALLREMPRLRHLRLTAMATSGESGSSLVRAALSAVAAADPPCLRALEVCGGLATAPVAADDGAADLLAPLLSAGAGNNLRRSLRTLKVTAALSPRSAAAAAAPSADNAPPRPLLSMADAFPALRSLALNNLLSSTFPTMDVADLPRGLERLDLRGWDVCAGSGGGGGGGADAAVPSNARSAVSRLSLRGCRASNGLAASARVFPGVTDAMLCGGAHHDDDGEADGVACAWPRLRSLTIAGGGGGGAAAAVAAVPSLLSAAARRCPHLREVRLQGLEELDARALADALRPAARTLRCLEVAAAANAAVAETDEGAGDDNEAGAAAAPDGDGDDAPAPPIGGAPDAAGVARALAPLEALRRLRVKAPGWRHEAQAALAQALARPWLAVEAVSGCPRLGDAAAARAFASAAFA